MTTLAPSHHYLSQLFSSILVTSRWRSRAVLAVKMVFVFMEKFSLLLLTEMVGFFLSWGEITSYILWFLKVAVYPKGFLIVVLNHCLKCVYIL